MGCKKADLRWAVHFAMWTATDFFTPETSLKIPCLSFEYTGRYRTGNPHPEAAPHWASSAGEVGGAVDDDGVGAGEPVGRRGGSDERNCGFI